MYVYIICIEETEIILNLPLKYNTLLDLIPSFPGFILKIFIIADL